MQERTTIDQLQAGWTAYGRDGDKIGDIEEVGPNYVLVTKGLIFVTDLYIPLSAIENLDPGEGRVYLNVDKSDVDNQGWNEPPTGDTLSQPDSQGDVEGLGYTGRETDVTAGSGVAYASQSTNLDTDAEYTTRDSGTYAGTTSDMGDRDTVRVPVHEEQLRAERMREQAGEVRLEKNVVEEEQTLDVPVTREEVEVRRVSTDRRAGTEAGAFESGDTIRVPVTAERVSVTKEPHVVEELEISKRPVTETQRVSERVRREEVDIEESGNVLAGAGASMSGTGHDLDDTTTTRSSRTDEDGDLNPLNDRR